MQTSEGGLKSQEVLWLIGSLCSLYRIPFDPSLVEQEFPPPHTLDTFHEAARALGFKTGTCTTAIPDWQKLPLPAIAFLRPTPKPDETGEETQPTLPVLSHRESAIEATEDSGLR